MSDLLHRFKAARRVSTPICTIRTPDPAATMAAIESSLNGTAPPVLLWDIARGITWRNEEGLKACWYDLREKPAGEPVPDKDQEQARRDFASDLGDLTQNAFEALRMAVRAPAKTVLFFANAHRVISEPSVTQAIWNLRDIYKANYRMLVLLCPDITLPAELQQDVLTIDEPLPDRSQLGDIVKSIYKAGKLEEPGEDVLDKAVDALSGLAAFPAEQASAMSLKRDGLNLEDLWDRKRRMIEATPGMTVNRSGETFDDIGGVENAKSFFRSVLSGAEPPRAIVFQDELEKSLGGSGSDSSGVSQGFLGTMLSYMQDNGINGSILIGPPGAAKSAIAKAVGNTANIPTIAFDMNGMKASLVGESEQRLRQALKVITAVSQGRALFIATCNSIGSLPPELRRRYNFGCFFFDLPTREEREIIWNIYAEKFKLAVDVERPADQDWTGAEIKQCCFLAYNLRVSLVEAAKFIVPVARSAAEQIQKLREQASGKFISASKPGYYRFERERAATVTAEARSVEFE